MRMRRWVRLAALVLVVRAIGIERFADAVRWADQRLELFSPRGAGLYARVAPRLLAPLYRAVAADVVGIHPRRVLDVGTGPGALAVEIARRCPTCEVVGVDLAPEMLATAAARAREAGVAARVTFQIGDAASLQLDDRSFDVTVSTLSLHHWRDPAAVLRAVPTAPSGRAGAHLRPALLLQSQAVQRFRRGLPVRERRRLVRGGSSRSPAGGSLRPLRTSPPDGAAARRDMTAWRHCVAPRSPGWGSSQTPKKRERSSSSLLQGTIIDGERRRRVMGAPRATISIRWAGSGSRGSRTSDSRSGQFPLGFGRLAREGRTLGSGGAPSPSQSSTSTVG